MSKSMSGFGRVILEDPGFTQVWEIKSVNSKYLDLKWRLPLFLRGMETDWEKIVREFAGRGRVEVSLNLSISKPELIGMSLNRTLTRAMLAEIRAFADCEGLEFKPDLNRIMGMQHLWQEGGEGPDENLVAELARGLRQALADWNMARDKEGRNLVRDLKNRLGILKDRVEDIKTLLPGIKDEKFATLGERVRLLLNGTGAELDQGRMLQELAIMADRLDVSEELTRLDSHLGQWKSMLDRDGDVGRRLDFLIQECFREINTCGNKSQDAEISRIVVEFKTELERCREQVQNLE